MEIRFNQISQQSNAETMYTLWRRTDAMGMEFDSICRQLDFDIVSMNNIDDMLAKMKTKFSDMTFLLKRHGDFLSETIEAYTGVERRINRLSDSIMNSEFYNNTPPYTSPDKPVTAPVIPGGDDCPKNAPIDALTIPEITTAVIPPSLLSVVNILQNTGAQNDTSDDMTLFEQELFEPTFRSRDSYLESLKQATPDSGQDERVAYLRSVTNMLGLPDLFGHLTSINGVAPLLNGQGAENGWFKTDMHDALMLAQDGFPVLLAYNGSAAFCYPSDNGECLAVTMENNVLNIFKIDERAECYVHL